MVKSRKFLMKVYEDVTAEMRCRRNFESQLVHYYFLFYTLVGIATVTLFQADKTQESFPVISPWIALLIAMITSFLTFRIAYDHKKYAEFGQIAVRVWKYFEMFTKNAYLKGEAIVPEKFKDYGMGRGYFYTCLLLWLMAGGMFIVLVILSSVI